MIFLLLSCASHPPAPPPEGAADVSARLHDAIGSIAIVDWEQSEAADVRVEFSMDPGTWLSSPTRALEAGPQSESLLGVPYAMDVAYRIVSDDGSGPIVTDTAVIRTADLPEGLPVPAVTASDPRVWGVEDRYLFGSVSIGDTTRSASSYWSFALDRHARVVWAQPTPDSHTTLFLRVSADGTRLVWDDSTFWSDLDRGAGSVVHRSRIDLAEWETIETPGLHYEFVDLPDGTIVWGDLGGIDELLVERMGSDEPHIIWSCADVRDVLGENAYKCGSNSLWWDARTDHFLLSLYTTSTVFEIDHTTGDTLRWFGRTEGAWNVDPSESGFEWQHGVSYTDKGNLLLLTHTSMGGGAGPILPVGVPSTAREYVLDETASTLRNVWTYDNGGTPIVALEGGDVHRLSNGNTLVSFGTGSKLREVTADGAPAWSLDWETGQRLGRTFFVSDLYALLR